MAHPLLIADEDEDLVCDLALELSADGYATLTVCSPTALALTLAHNRAELVLLGDLEGPAVGARIVRSIRETRDPFTSAAPATPIVVLASNHGQLALLRAFEAGADDFIAKPASYLELRARIRAVLARTSGQRRSPVVRIGALEVDTDHLVARYAGQPVALTQLEFALLACLSETPSRIWAKAELLRLVWGFENPTAARTRTVDAHACRLRRKLDAAGARHLIVNRRGVGYALTTPGNGNGNGDGGRAA